MMRHRLLARDVELVLRADHASVGRDEGGKGAKKKDPLSPPARRRGVGETTVQQQSWPRKPVLPAKHGKSKGGGKGKKLQGGEWGNWIQKGENGPGGRLEKILM